MRQIRISILVVVSILIAIGIVMIYSASAIYAYERLKDSLFYLKRHLLFLLIGIPPTIFVMSIDYAYFKKYARLLLLISFILLVAVLIPGLGYQAGGARRWFHFGPFNFQPSEAMKLSMIIYLADALSRKGSEIKSFLTGFAPLVLVLGLSIGLILLEPDLGTAVSISCIAFIMLFVAGTRLEHILYSFLAALPVLLVAVFGTTYRRNRITAFLHPWQDPRGTSFQIIQSFLALGSGGLIGVGLGQSTQKLFYLPAAYTDFIFSIIGEELGLIGTLSVVGLFFIFAVQGTRVVLKCNDHFGKLMSLGVVSMITLETLVHIGVSIGAIPTKGLPLPFISYGGSALIFNMMAVGLLLNVAKGSPQRGAL
ncbi:MAG: putative lipid II flippase FtsW [Candidatus Omnitrophica bacterium CG07_land_8_20_14_0_80_42_15]|uniref:Probable peptidoglycan glycosyltransferase FtsW n=1 Tax=Candidatus Aquitaenariimonas noxiae TaxID=1974741 RepID=A0A2J0L2X7_9BACT|nr:MAG: putative lipid II flippase FtsW [Candidatus Omnitrophica bacterium CG07_land_8_20_14_0_80_42_15]